MRRLAILLLVSGLAQAAPPQALLATHFDGERALQNVEALDRYIRWPGNRHFDASLARLIDSLESAGYVDSAAADAKDRLIYRVDAVPMRNPAWLPLQASLKLGGRELLNLATNRNMLAVHSHDADLSATVVAVDTERLADLPDDALRGRIALIEGEPARVADRLLGELGAAGILAYSMPAYTRPEVNRSAIQFRKLPYVSARSDWAIMLSLDAYTALTDALNAGPVTVAVRTRVEWRANALDRALVATVRGSLRPEQEFLFSAHLQEPGANDNASGVATQLEMARVTADLLKEEKIDPLRSLTFLWGNEIASTRRYADASAGHDVRWGIALDMVGANTNVTGGSFLIEKMPDPSAIWQRGGESFSEWGGRPLLPSDMRPHFLNDLVLHYARQRSRETGWRIGTNPFEGGSDHVPFLDSGIPAVLLWHFTDPFYHTDLDRPDKVSAEEMQHVGVTALAVALALTDAGNGVFANVLDIVLSAGHARLAREARLNRDDELLSMDEEARLLALWHDWYRGALDSLTEIPMGAPSAAQAADIEKAKNALSASYRSSIEN